MSSPPELTYAPTALRQLSQIGRDERFTESARRTMIARIIAACEDCAAHPHRYPKSERAGFRKRRVAPFILDYRVTEVGVEIAHVWHERQSRGIPSRE
jgi:plasmid stabilization system protein ParE